MPDDNRRDQASSPMPVPRERIAKRMARAGLCSRRDAERWIADGRVAVDGEVLTTPAVTVTAVSRIEVDGKPLPKAEAPRLFRFHKPQGYLTAVSDPEGRKTIAELMPEGLPRLMPIGRLDMNSEGLLLLTNDGELKRQLELPSTGWQRRYRVRVHGDVDEVKLASLAKGISINGFDYGPIEAQLERTLGKNAWLSVALREGKNREIRRVMEHFGWPVNRLIRISFGPFHLGKLPRKDVEEIKAKVVKDQLGFVLQSTTFAAHRKRRLSVASAKVGPNKDERISAARQQPKRRGQKDAAERKETSPQRTVTKVRNKSPRQADEGPGTSYPKAAGSKTPAIDQNQVSSRRQRRR